MEIHFRYPHLSLAQIHASLAYYYDQKEAFDTEIQTSLQEYQRRRDEGGQMPLRKRLGELSKLP